jgi:hypothetical protein
MIAVHSRLREMSTMRKIHKYMAKHYPCLDEKNPYRLNWISTLVGQCTDVNGLARDVYTFQWQGDRNTYIVADCNPLMVGIVTRPLATEYISLSAKKVKNETTSR